LIYFPDFSSVENWFVKYNHTRLVTVRNGSVLGNDNASYLICNSDFFGPGGANKINFYSDAHAFSYLNLYKQSKEKIDFFYLRLVVVPGLAWEFLYDKDINLPNPH
jgi:hypothetical protein